MGFYDFNAGMILEMTDYLLDYFEFESASWSDPSGADKRTKPWLSGPRALCTEKPGIGSADKMLLFIQDQIRTSFIQLSCSFVLNAKAGRYVTRTLVNFAKYV